MLLSRVGTVRKEVIQLAVLDRVLNNALRRTRSRVASGSMFLDQHTFYGGRWWQHILFHQVHYGSFDPEVGLYGVLDTHPLFGWWLIGIKDRSTAEKLGFICATKERQRDFPRELEAELLWQSWKRAAEAKLAAEPDSTQKKTFLATLAAARCDAY